MMHEHITASVLIELGRIGVDFDTLSVPLAGTGLRASEIVAWLRAIPDGAGSEELALRLEERARDALGDRLTAVRWRREPARPPHRTRRERWWPTQPLVDAGTDLLAEEWDPFGIRHAGVEREDVAMFAFHLFGCFLAPNGSIDPLTHATEMIASAERDHLALKPSPERHRRYLAGRLRDLVDQYPVPAVEHWPPSHLVVVAGAGGGPPPLDPEGVCVRCHAFGTVARLTIMTQPSKTNRYCEPCWKIVRAETFEPPLTTPRTAAEHIARLDRSLRPPMTAESRSWADTIDNIRSVEAADLDTAGVGVAERAAHFARIAAELVKMEDRMAGPMPPEVEAFVRRYTSPDQPSAPASDQH